jgi:hypothetical protein
MLSVMTILGINSCNNNLAKTEITVENWSVSTFSDSIYTPIPGSLICTDNFVVWEDPVQNPFIHILDKQSGKEVYTFGEKGQGPNEFITPDISKYNKDTIFVFDYNNKKQAFLSVSDKNMGFAFCEEQKLQDLDGTILKLSPKQSVLFSTTWDKPFIFVNGNDSTKFGVFPIVGDFSTDGRVRFQGNLNYNPETKILVYDVFAFPYFAIYQFKNNNFELRKEIKENVDYKISEGRLVIDNSVVQKGSLNTTLTKDYIVSVEYDYDNEKVELPKGRDVSKLPHCLFLRNYDGELVRKLDLCMPIMRVAGDVKSNEIFIVVANPDFAIVKTVLK